MSALVTIGMPVFQNAKSVRRAISSVQAQTFSDWKLIVSDDGSSDDSLEIAQRAAGTDPRISVIRTPERLGYMNFRHALRGCETNWVVWLAGDDFWAPRFLEACLAVTQDQPDAVSVLTGWTYTGLYTLTPKTEPLDRGRVRRVRQFLAAPGGTRMYGLTKRSVFEAAFPKRNFHGFDWYYVLGLLKAGHQPVVPETLLFREKTPLGRYVTAASEENHFLFKRWPILEMSLSAIRAGLVPPGNLIDLAMLNVRKHEEHLAFINLDAYRRRLFLFRAAGLPLANSQSDLTDICKSVALERPDQRSAALRLLSVLARSGKACSALAMAQILEEDDQSGDLRDAYQQATHLGDALAAFRLARYDRDNDRITEEEFWAQVIAMSSTSSEAAAFVANALREDTIPQWARAAATYGRNDC